MIREHCGGCGRPELEPFLDLGTSPVANTFPTTLSDEPRYPLELAVCTRCWLVQQLELVPDDVLYGHEYDFYSGASLPKVQYHQDLSRRLYREYREQARRLTVEVGCNDGDLLRHFYDVGCNAVGVDPAEGPTQAAITHGLPVMQAKFGTETAAKIVHAQGEAGLIIANHVVAHVSDLDDVFSGFRQLLAADGVLVIEVQYLVDLLVGNQLDHVYHEHRFHFSVTSLANLALRYGFWLSEVQHTPAQSGSISCTFRRLVTAFERTKFWRPDEAWLSTLSAYQSMQARAEHVRERLLTLLNEERQAGRRVAGYAAPAKAVTLLNYCGLSSDEVEYIVDTTPVKANTYLPGTNVPVVGRDWDGSAAAQYTMTRPIRRELPDTWLLLAHNYLGDVLRREWEFTTGGGRWLVPIPVPVVL